MATYVSDYQTQAFGTEIVAICPPNGSKIPVLRGLAYTAAGTEHNAYVMSPLGVTTTITPTPAGDTTMELASIDPGKTTAGVDEDLAASDWIVYETEHGNLEARKISSVSGSTVTIAAVTDDVANGAKVWGCYEAGRSSNKQLRLAASVETKREELHIQGGIPAQDGIQAPVTGVAMPLLVVIDNGTAAGKLDYASFYWVDSDEDFLS